MYVIYEMYALKSKFIYSIKEKNHLQLKKNVAHNSFTF